MNYVAFVVGRWRGQRGRPDRSLLASLGGAAAADAQVVGGVVDNALERDHDAVQEAFEGVDVTCIQVLVRVVEGDGHHDEDEELQQKREEASSGRCFFGGDRAGPSGERLGVRAALGQDCALHAGLVQPVIGGLQRSASCSADGTPAGRTVQETIAFFLLIEWTHTDTHERDYFHERLRPSGGAASTTFASATRDPCVIDYLMPVGVLISLARISSTTPSLAFFGVSSTKY